MLLRGLFSSGSLARQILTRKDYQKDETNLHFKFIRILICIIFFCFFQGKGKLAILQAENSEVKAVRCLETQ